MTDALVTLSVVSHRQNRLVNQLIDDVDQHCKAGITVVLTENVPDAEEFAASASHPTDRVRNAYPKGFGANHNAAFRRCRTPYFCVMNPDVRLHADPFPQLVSVVSKPTVGVVGPLIRNPDGGVEDSARRFPTPAALVRKLFTAPAGADYPSDRGPLAVDWVAGMCMLFRSSAYEAVQGFDERYFLYYEDVDLCRRLQRLRLAVIYEPRVEVVHDARRASRRNPRLALHHAKSMARYLLSARGEST